MKKNIVSFIFPFLLLLLIIFAPEASEGAANGLVLWYRQVLPALMPFTLILQVMMANGTVLACSRFLNVITKKIFGLSPVCSFCILSGFLCGFPTGALTAVQAADNHLISQDEAQILVGTCNNAGPMFISSYILEKQLHVAEQRGILTCLFYLSAILWLFIRSRMLTRTHTADSYFSPDKPLYAPTGTDISYRSILLKSAELMLKIGVFMMLFSIFSTIMSSFTFIPEKAAAILSLLIEITTGAASISVLSISNQIKTVLIMSGTAFGGLCIAAQTYSIIHSQKLSFVTYLMDKLIISLMTACLTFLCIKLSV
jgi:hypothetical protein